MASRRMAWAGHQHPANSGHANRQGRWQWQEHFPLGPTCCRASSLPDRIVQPAGKAAMIGMLQMWSAITLIGVNLLLLGALVLQG
jgi:hypothetical protein